MEQINIEALAALVRKMRVQQQEYYKWKTKTFLIQCKRTEARVDQILKLIPAPKEDLHKYSQTNLFNHERT